MNMKRFSKYFLRGLIAILPLALTVYLLVLLVAWLESTAMTLLSPFIGSFYVPGMGLVLGILGIFALGALLSGARVQKVMTYVEMPFTTVPVVKSIYSSLKSFADYFSPRGKQDGPAQQVVLLRLPDQPLEVVGLVTRHGVDGLPEGFLQDDRVAVYLPMGYMIGGYTVFVPRSWVHPIAMSVEEAMRSSLIAWMSRSTDPLRPGPAETPAAAAVVPPAAATATDTAAPPAAADGEADAEDASTVARQEPPQEPRA
ncbi:putative exported protein [plant metagenome]|uniref:Putative exported protein n=3 Tax=root TaxID=1 RepID=A0A1C3K5C7_9BURK|nr:putative exported protein [Orrella dioscoreae]SOE49430.1 putative exported protein [Orrella dioscoreae]